jgi:hypothetical protein
MGRPLSLLLLLLLCWPLSSPAAVINIEFKFTPFIGDPAKSASVEIVPGKVSIYMNNIPIAEQEVTKKEVPVLFEEREVAAAIWLPVKSLGPALRKGKNKIRIEFNPADTKLSYRVQFRWASVTDQITKTEDETGKVRETNQSNEGVDDKSVTGHVAFEREFAADFAADLPWHNYRPVTELNDADKKSLSILVKEREKAFQPDFGAAYKIIENNKQGIDPVEVKKAKCLETGYAAGVRVASQPADRLNFIATGNPEVVIQGKTNSLYYLLDPESFDRIKDENVQMCISVIFFSILYPPRLVVVRNPSGKWEVVY